MTDDRARWLAGGGLAMVLVVAIVAAALSGVSFVGPAGPTIAPSPSPASTAAAGESGRPVARPPAAIEDALWWRLGWRPRGDAQPPDWETMTVGRFDGEVLGQIAVGASVQLGSGAPFVVGPRSGLILYATHAAGLSELHLLDAEAGVHRKLASTRGTLHHAAISPAGGLAYYAADQAHAGIWRVPLDGSEPAELIVTPPELGGVGADALLAAPIDALPRVVTLEVDDAGERLAMLTCTERCTLRLIDVAEPNAEHVVVDGLAGPLTTIVDVRGDVVVLDGGASFVMDTGEQVPTPEEAETRPRHQMGYELPAAWRIEVRPDNPNAQVVGLTHYVLVDPNGDETRIDVLGEGPGQG